MKYYKIIDGKLTIKPKKNIIIYLNGKQIINPPVQMILEDGWKEYIQEPVIDNPFIHEEDTKTSYDLVQDVVIEWYNSKTDISDKDALDRAIIIYDWDKYIGKQLQIGQVVGYNKNVYRVRQTHVVQEQYYPSLDTASLYEVIVLTATGEKDDPISYNPPMEIFNDKYYIQNDVIYHCVRDSQIALSHNLKDLIGIYVEII